ncbi:hypothetical protein [Nocardioides sp. YIM 152315]|uniref:hypothetical protein n=1 Tax=Nocardioides sp. YIM 152315 TaxID=3031760 RepID=UPI0023DCC62E|nr:hypothetical protein [Nocardioides sp. YIM 152315]MDF1602155.1 hypothetical protein [Nocardioides sp. YIM 152315]
MSVQTTAPAPTGPAPLRRAIKEIVTVHPDASVSLQLALLDAIEATLRREGVDRIWVDPDSAQLVVVAEVDD